MTTYIYRGDKLTDPALKGATVSAVQIYDPVKKRMKCVRGRNGNMLVLTADGRRTVVPGRRLKKI